MKICKNCEKEFPLTIVIDGKKRILQHRKFCLTCSPFGQHNTRDITNPVKDPKHYTHIKTFRSKQKAHAIEYLGGKCCVCGYDRSIRGLAFHHVDSTLKSFSISGASLAFDKLKKELDKCLLVCSNCHAEIHDGIIMVEY